MYSRMAPQFVPDRPPEFSSTRFRANPVFLISYLLLVANTVIAGQAANEIFLSNPAKSCFQRA